MSASHSFVLVGNVEGLAPEHLDKALDLLMEAMVASDAITDPAIGARLDGKQVEVEFMFSPRAPAGDGDTEGDAG